MEDGEEGATVSSNSSLNGSLSPKKGLRDDLRTFRMDKDEANKNQVSLLRYFRSEVKPSGKEKSSDSMKKESSGDSGNSDQKGNTSQVSLRNFKKDMDDSNRNSPRKVIMGPSDVTSDTSRKKIIMRPSDIRSRILSRPLFVDAPSPVSK
ncbi:hypothetical protein OTU49_005686, partial [Cherax quadricarinatus]